MRCLRGGTVTSENPVSQAVSAASENLERYMKAANDYLERSDP